MIQEATNNNKQSIFVAIFEYLLQFGLKNDIQKMPKLKNCKSENVCVLYFYFIWKVTETDSLFVSIPLSENNQVFQ